LLLAHLLLAQALLFFLLLAALLFLLLAHFLLAQALLFFLLLAALLFFLLAHFLLCLLGAFLLDWLFAGLRCYFAIGLFFGSGFWTHFRLNGLGRDGLGGGRWLRGRR